MTKKTFIQAEIHDLLGQVHREEISFSKMVEILNEKANPKQVLFIDANMYNVFEGETIYYVVLTAGGGYKLDWQTSEEIHANMAMWNLLMDLSIVKGLYKNKEKAEESVYDANATSAIEINKAFLKELKK